MAHLMTKVLNVASVLLAHGNVPCPTRKYRSPGRLEESHLQSPTDPYVNLSIHTARASHSLKTSWPQGDTEKSNAPPRYPADDSSTPTTMAFAHSSLR